ncbi:MAG: exodeoxyribonuclease VII large subunit [Clostridiales bacterium]|nr:exodeoxyribonuclease VII large subunit [Clostridiales bacterium]
MAGKLTLSVSQLNEYIRRMLQLDPMLHGVELKGEISNLKFHQTGTIFFTLKDELSSIACVMYASYAAKLQAAPFEGMRAVVSGSVGFYTKGGQLQFYANNLRAEGVGVLYERLMALKAKLAGEGLFAQERKRALPAFPDTIGVVTSPTGAVIHDIMNVSLRRNPDARILLCPVRVQGIGAADEVVQAIELLEKMDSVSVIIVARGGGSMEDLWTFNEEAVVRAVAACSKPVVSAVGHETDVTLCDLAADLRAPTPSAAAECVVPLKSEILSRLSEMRSAIAGAVLWQIERKQTAMDMLSARLSLCHPQRRLQEEARQLAQKREALVRCMEKHMESARRLLEQRRRELEMLSPYRVLARGYAIVTKEGMPVLAASQLAAGDSVVLRFADGIARAQIEETENKEG